MTSTPIFDALAEELEATWHSSGEVREQARRSEAGGEDAPLSGHLE